MVVTSFEVHGPWYARWRSTSISSPVRLSLVLKRLDMMLKVRIRLVLMMQSNS